MPRSRDQNDWDDESEDLPEGVYHDPESGLTRACPYCRELVPDDAQFCGRCENYISLEDSPASRKPLWIWVCLILALGVAILTAF